MVHSPWPTVLRPSGCLNGVRVIRGDMSVTSGHPVSSFSTFFSPIDPEGCYGRASLLTTPPIPRGRRAAIGLRRTDMKSSRLHLGAICLAVTGLIALGGAKGRAAPEQTYT